MSGTIPSAPPLPADFRERETLSHTDVPEPEFRPESETDPRVFARLVATLVDEKIQKRDEIFAKSIDQFTESLNRVADEQLRTRGDINSLGRSFDSLRTEMRARAGAHDTELDRLRGQLEELRAAQAEGAERQAALEQRIKLLETAHDAENP